MSSSSSCGCCSLSFAIYAGAHGFRSEPEARKACLVTVAIIVFITAVARATLLLEYTPPPDNAFSGFWAAMWLFEGVAKDSWMAWVALIATWIALAGFAKFGWVAVFWWPTTGDAVMVDGRRGRILEDGRSYRPYNPPYLVSYADGGSHSGWLTPAQVTRAEWYKCVFGFFAVILLTAVSHSAMPSVNGGLKHPGGAKPHFGK